MRVPGGLVSPCLTGVERQIYQLHRTGQYRSRGDLAFIIGYLIEIIEQLINAAYR
jgi:hypothetical protein